VLFSTPQLISSGLTHTNPKFRLHFLWVWNLVSDIKGRKLTDGVWGQGAEENIWT
jgi:hypothetical protein